MRILTREEIEILDDTPNGSAVSIYLNPDPESGDADLLDLAAVQTLLKGGTVYALEPDVMPHQARLAAIFRYAA